METLVPIISRTDDWISGSVILLICPFLTSLSQIWRGLDLYGSKTCVSKHFDTKTIYNLPDGVKNREETGLVGSLEHFNLFLFIIIQNTQLIIKEHLISLYYKFK